MNRRRELGDRLVETLTADGWGRVAEQSSLTHTLDMLLDREDAQAVEIVREARERVEGWREAGRPFSEPAR